jgi:hypothetical protein
MKALVLFFVCALLWQEPGFAAGRKKRAKPRRAPLSTPAPAPEPVLEPESEPEAPPTVIAIPEESDGAVSSTPPPGMVVSDRRIGRRGWLVLPTLGISRYKYQETARADFESTAFAFGLSAHRASRRGWLAGGDLDVTVTTVSNSDAKRPTGFARLALFGGRAIFTGDWDLSVKLGLQGRTMFTNGLSYGYSTLNGAFASPGVAYHFSSSNMLRLQGRFVHCFVSPFSLSNRELGAELSWVVGLSRRTYLLAIVGYSNHTFTMGNTTVKADDTHLRIGLAF